MDISGTNIKKISDKGYYHIPCAVTGKPCLCGEERLEKLIKRYGTLKKVCENYVSRDGKRLLKHGMQKDKIRKIGAEEAVELSKMLHKEKIDKRTERKERKERKKKVKEVRDQVLPTILFNRDDVRPHVVNLDDKEEVAVLTRNTCMYPDVYLYNDRACNHCRLEKLCVCHIKRIRIRSRKELD